MYRTGTPPELERKPSYNTLEIGGKSAKFLTRSGSLGSRHRLIPSSQFSPSSNPFSENRLANPNKRALLSRTESGSLRIGTLLNLTHVIVTMALLVTCTVLYRDRLIKADFIDACEKDHVTTRHELELSLDELSRYKILQNTFHTVPTPPTKCPECPSVRTPHYPVPGTKKKAVSTAQVDNSNVIALKRLIEERDDLEKKLKTAHLKASPGFTKIIESYRASESLLIEVIQAMSAELLALKYGPGPYYAEFVLGFASVDIAPKHILIELAAKEMPYTTLYFMTQLEAGMWRGCHVNFNPGHILLADPNVLPIYPGRFEEIVGACQRASFNGVPYADSEGHLAFREYADSKPHVPFTLGIPGRSGGPSFYINTLDNTQSHGPGGQPFEEINLAEQGNLASGSSSGVEGQPADPCFGRIVSGYDVIQQLQQIRVVGGENSNGQLGSFVTILDATLVHKPRAAINKRLIDNIINSKSR